MKNNFYRIEKRPGWTRICPSCSQNIKYTKLINSNYLTPFFYSEANNDVLLRDSDIEKVERFVGNGSLNFKELDSFWRSILESAPLALGGESYGLWANIKCPHCWFEFPYDAGAKNMESRIKESTIVLIDGANVVNDTNETSWTIEVFLESST